MFTADDSLPSYHHYQADRNTQYTDWYRPLPPLQIVWYGGGERKWGSSQTQTELSTSEPFWEIELLFLNTFLMVLMTIQFTSNWQHLPFLLRLPVKCDLRGHNNWPIIVLKLILNNTISDKSFPVSKIVIIMIRPAVAILVLFWRIQRTFQWETATSLWQVSREDSADRG